MDLRKKSFLRLFFSIDNKMETIDVIQAVWNFKAVIGEMLCMSSSSSNWYF